jgi:ADP-ribose pyrophosphatase
MGRSFYCRGGNDLKLEETVLSSERLYEGKIINLRRDMVALENGREAAREIIEHPGGVGILPLDQDGTVYMVRQYRHGAGEVVLEIPAGKLNYGEDALACGKRELLEEIGAVAQEYIPLGKIFPTPAYCEEIIPIFLAKGLSFSGQKLDEGEFLHVEKVPLRKLLSMVMDGELPDCKTQIAVLKTAVLEGLLKEQ